MGVGESSARRITDSPHGVMPDLLTRIINRRSIRVDIASPSVQKIYPPRPKLWDMGNVSDSRGDYPVIRSAMGELPASSNRFRHGGFSDYSTGGAIQIAALRHWLFDVRMRGNTIAGAGFAIRLGPNFGLGVEQKRGTTDSRATARTTIRPHIRGDEIVADFRRFRTPRESMPQFPALALVAFRGFGFWRRRLSVRVFPGANSEPSKTQSSRYRML